MRCYVDFEMLLAELERRKERAEHELKLCPQGSIVLDRSGGKEVFLWAYSDKNGKNVRKRLSRYPETVPALMRRQYLENEISIITANQSHIKGLASGYSDMLPDSILKTVPERYRRFPEKLFFIPMGDVNINDEIQGIYAVLGKNPTKRLLKKLSEAPSKKIEKASRKNSDSENLSGQIYKTRDLSFDLAHPSGIHPGWPEEASENHPSDYKWAGAPYERSSYHDEEKKHRTTRGLKVRSKGELLIAEKLYEYNLPFRYEEVLLIDGKRIVPDFIVRARNGKFYYWEHCGLMDDEDYRRRYYRKLMTYAKADIGHWKNLILTYDDAESGTDLCIVESEIKNKLL